MTTVTLSKTAPTLKATHRIASIDILRGIVMIIMALDHTRDFFHHDAQIGNDPLNFQTTWPFLFFTRWITHYCAPIFVFLSGTSVFLYAQRGKTKKEVAWFLFTRGVWLIIAEIVIVNGLWQFNYTTCLILEVFWAIGMSMVCLSFLQLLPYRGLLVIGLLIVFGHNALDGVQVAHPAAASVVWSLTHAPNLYQPVPHYFILVAYPFLPWVGVMICGYCLGKLYTKNIDPAYRKRFLLTAGIIAIALFVILKFINIYGDRQHWSLQKTAIFTVLDFVNTTKYPPSLLYMLMTIGPGLIVLAATEHVANTFTRKVMVYGRVPFVYYMLHILVLHSLALIFMLISGRGSGEPPLPGYTVYPNAGYPLWVVYLVWISVVILLYFPCRWYGRYRAAHPEKVWLTYL
jgi:uncharacterized membrane protein